MVGIPSLTIIRNDPNLNTTLKELELVDSTLNLAISSYGKVTGTIGTAVNGT